MIESKLVLHALELQVVLGWSAAERMQPQTIWVDVELCFSTPPKACETEQLQDTLCYYTLTQKLQENLTAKSFKLIEHLAAYVFHLTKQLCPSQSTLSIRVTKKPMLCCPNAGASFIYAERNIW